MCKVIPTNALLLPAGARSWYEKHDKRYLILHRSIFFFVLLALVLALVSSEIFDFGGEMGTILILHVGLTGVIRTIFSPSLSTF
ncbi:MAG: hypothetical protein IPN86_24640 [Saprospiraceae bacterium]|nr:hypothetical protein [Saprospiraceae bacterium]